MGIQSFGLNFAEVTTTFLHDYILFLQTTGRTRRIAIDLSILMFIALRGNAGTFLAFNNPQPVSLSVIDMLAPLLALKFEIFFVMDGKRPQRKIASRLREEQRQAHLARAAEIRNSLLTCTDPNQIKLLIAERDKCLKSSLKPSPAFFSHFQKKITEDFPDLRIHWETASYEADSHLVFLSQRLNCDIISTDTDLFALGMDRVISSIKPSHWKLQTLKADFRALMPLHRCYFRAILGNDYLPGGLKRIGRKLSTCSLNNFQ